MKHALSNILLITLSSLCWFLGLHTFGWCWWLIVCAFTPLFIVARNQGNRISLIDGLWLGVVFFALHLHSFFVCMYHDRGVVGIGLVLLLILYMSLWPALVLQGRFLFIRLNILFFIINYFSGFFIEPLCGYVLCHPVCAFMVTDSVLGATQRIPRELLLVFILSCSYVYAQLISLRNTVTIFYSILAVVTMVALTGIAPRQQRISLFYCVPPQHESPFEQAAALVHLIDIAPCDTIPVTQESTFAYPLQEYAYILGWIKRNGPFFMHVHLEIQQELYNAVLYIKEGGIQHVFFKQRHVPFVETFAHHRPTRETCILNEKKSYPLICSDIFIESLSDRLNPDCKIPVYNEYCFSRDYLFLMRRWCLSQLT